MKFKQSAGRYKNENAPQSKGSVAMISLNELRLQLFLAVAITAQELVYTTSGIDEFLLAGEEGVRSVGDFKLNQGISLAINFDSFLRVHC